MFVNCYGLGENTDYQSVKKEIQNEIFDNIDIFYKAVIEYSELQQWLDENKITLKYLNGDIKEI